MNGVDRAVPRTCQQRSVVRLEGVQLVVQGADGVLNRANIAGAQRFGQFIFEPLPLVLTVANVLFQACQLALDKVAAILLFLAGRAQLDQLIHQFLGHSLRPHGIHIRHREFDHLRVRQRIDGILGQPIFEP